MICANRLARQTKSRPSVPVCPLLHTHSSPRSPSPLSPPALCWASAPFRGSFLKPPPRFLPNPWASPSLRSPRHECPLLAIPDRPLPLFKLLNLLYVNKVINESNSYWISSLLIIKYKVWGFWTPQKPSWVQVFRFYIFWQILDFWHINKFFVDLSVDI